ncbi:DUF7289 family protein [Halopiger goleimassiliensis]|uniref:DUF7289 family protein n=1 Tax=Halopiger goleimassiliensis TaxID=1293048 RepID=UPI001E514A24|nr:hypothetical protein [Halopiger goleimassiliensis]
MSIRRDDRRVDLPSRGQSAVLGMVLLIGMAATISVGLFFVASDAATSLEQESEQERIETAFVEMSQELTTTTMTADSPRSIDLDVGQDGAVVREDSGWINVTSDALAEGDLTDMTIGTIEYVGSGGTTIAYESGAVFRETGNETQLVSTPRIHYTHETNTLHLPVITTVGEDHLSSGDVTFATNRTEPFRNVNVVENESVTITIHSDYYRGWERFFKNEAGDTSVQDVDHDNRTVEIEVGYLDIDQAYEDGIVVSENFDGFDNADVEDGSVRHGTMPELDEVIEEMVEEEQADADPISSSDTAKGNGTYWTDEELYIGDELEFDLSEGNATLIVDDDITIEGELRAVPGGTDNELKIYTTGNLDIEGGHVSVVGGETAQLQVYGTSETHVGIGPGSSSYTGTMYVSREAEWGDKDNEVFHQGQCQEQVCMQSNVEFTGALIAASTNVHSASVDFEYDEALRDSDIDLYPDEYTLPPQLTYLNVAHHEIEVDNT